MFPTMLSSLAGTAWGGQWLACVYVACYLMYVACYVARKPLAATKHTLLGSGGGEYGDPGITTLVGPP